MEIRVLRYFLAIAREENMTKAADILHVTQPTLSRQIAQMEEELGVKLFLRSPRKTELTEEGLLLKRRAEEIIELEEKAGNELRNSDRIVDGVISIASGDIMAVNTLACLIRDFHKAYPLVKFDLYTATTEHIKDRLDRGLSDIGFLIEPVELEKYNCIRLPDKEEWVVATYPDSAIAALERVRPEDLEGEDIILPNRPSLQNEIRGWLGSSFAKANVIISSNLPSGSSVLCHQKVAHSIILKGSISYWDASDLVCRPLSPALTSDCVIAWKRDQPFPKACSRFIEFMKVRLNCDA